jgi:hypothetical protein
MIITTRQELKDYCLRRLGFPVIEINVDDDQVEDRIQDAIDYWNEYHFDGVERIFLKEQIEASTLKLATPTANTFTVKERIVGETSGARADVHAVAGTDLLKIRKVNGVFVDGETITGVESGISASLAATDAYTIKNWTSGEFEVSDAVTGVIRIFNLGTAGGVRTSTNIFDVVYQFRLNDMYNLLSSDLIYYSQVKTHLELLDMMFSGIRTIRFNRKQNKISVDVNMNDVFVEGDYVVFEVYRVLNPADWSKVYNDMFIKRYATALIKRQWGSNMSKFDGMQLPGGVVMNGTKIYQEAVDEIMKLEEEMQSRYELPPDFFVG